MDPAHSMLVLLCPGGDFSSGSSSLNAMLIVASHHFCDLRVFTLFKSSQLEPGFKDSRYTFRIAN